MTIPHFDINGLLPIGIHETSWNEFENRFGYNFHRKRLLNGLWKALTNMKLAGCTTIFIDGSFVTSKELPNDYDCCWDTSGVTPNLLDAVFFDFSNFRAVQKTKYGGEFFPAHILEKSSGKVFLDFFQIDKDTGNQKGIVKINLQSLKI
jgi:hypothetical protein